VSKIGNTRLEPYAGKLILAAVAEWRFLVARFAGIGVAVGTAVAE